jgi:signal transduction histidine kinase
MERITPAQWQAVDTGLAGLFFLGALGHLFRGFIVGAPTSTPWWILGLVYAATTIPIAFRRRWPIFALACTCGGLAITTGLGYSFAPAPVIALPLYSLTVSYSRRKSLFALLLVEAVTLGSVIVANLLRPTSGDVTFNIVLAGATWFVGDSVRTRRVYRAGLVEQAEERQRREIDRAQGAIVEERLEIARELHDVVAHSLSVIAIQSGVGRHVIDTQPDEARKALLAVESTSRAALDELRRVLGVLRRNGAGSPELSPAPALSDLDSLVDRVRAAGVPVEVEISGNRLPLPQGLELSVYRIVQEALTNVAKHTLSAPTTVRIQYESDDIVVEVVNRGPGSRSSSQVGGANGTGAGQDSRKTHGIVGMRERAAAFGGTLSAAPLPGGGFRVLAHLPIESPS